jgi:hypothetical protein
MSLIVYDDSQNDDDDIGVDGGDVDNQELEAIAYRFIQVVPDCCQSVAKDMANNGIAHPVVFLCDVADSFGLAIAKKVSSVAIIEKALRETSSERRPGIISCLDLDVIGNSEPTIGDAIRGRMVGLIGYFPIVIAAKGGFTVFPWPYHLEEGSKFKLFSPFD